MKKSIEFLEIYARNCHDDMRVSDYRESRLCFEIDVTWPTCSFYGASAPRTISGATYEEMYKNFVNFCDSFDIGYEQAENEQNERIEDLEELVVDLRDEIDRLNQLLAIQTAALEGATQQTKRRM